MQRARGAATRLARLGKSLAAKQRELDQLAAVKAAATASLVSARSERLCAIAALARRGRPTSPDRALGEKARTLASVRAAPSTRSSRPARRAFPRAGSAGVRSLTVVATGYALPGRTASGRAVGWGVVAVDPSVIPMGSRIAIPGYGMGVAADTGGAIAGARIDLWFPSAQAHDWGSRTVTVTVYPN